MKKDRNYPIYPNMGYPMPMMNQPMMNQPIMNQPMMDDSYTVLEQRVNTLEKRVTALENSNSVGYSNKFNDSNFHMM